jgi:hypothetical protein
LLGSAVVPSRDGRAMIRAQNVANNHAIEQYNSVKWYRKSSAGGATTK